MRLLVGCLMLLVIGEVGSFWIFPGTNFCGSNWNARDLDDLGSSAEADYCCREHDLCNDTLVKGESRHGLTNTGFFTLSHCDCDERLYQCLTEAPTYEAMVIGFFFFSVLKPGCFKEDLPRVCSDDINCALKVPETALSKTWKWFPSKAW